MIKRLRIKDFESHKDSTINFSDGFNAIVAQSNTGKSSIIRALKLVAYNQFEKKAVRLGAKFVEVEVETHRGKVLVRRGEGVNEWWINKIGTPEVYLRSPGVNSIPQAIEVLGFGPVKIGDVKVEAHLMDQLEAHFLISAIGSEKASGSTRAQVVDNISGLTGAESLIQDIALDLTRLNKAENDDNEKLADLNPIVVPELILVAEEDAIKALDKRLTDIEASQSSLEAITSLAVRYSGVSNNLSEAIKRSEGLKLPDLTELAEVALKIKKANEAVVKYRNTTNELDIISKKILPMPDLTDIEKCVSDLSKASKLSGQYSKASTELEALQKVNTNIPDLSALIDMRDRIRLLNKVAFDASVVGAGLVSSMVNLKKVESSLASEEEQLKELMKSVTVCPITGKPIEGGCLA